MSKLVYESAENNIRARYNYSISTISVNQSSKLDTKYYLHDSLVRKNKNVKKYVLFYVF